MTPLAAPCSEGARGEVGEKRPAAFQGGGADRKVEKMKAERFEKALMERFGAERGAWLASVSRNDPNRCPHQSGTIMGLWTKARTVDGFLEALRRDESLRLRSQAWAEFAKRLRWDLPFARVGCEVMVAESDAGSVLVGDEAGTLGMRIDNGRGDGASRILVCGTERCLNTDMMDWRGAIEGRFIVYGYDCSRLDARNAVATLEGRYGVYSWDGTVAFVRMEDRRGCGRSDGVDGAQGQREGGLRLHETAEAPKPPPPRPSVRSRAVGAPGRMATRGNPIRKE